MSFEIKLNDRDVAIVTAMLVGLSADVVPKVISRTINDGLAGVKTDASTEIRAIITPTKKAVDGTFKITKATVANLTGVFQSTGRPLSLIEFSARQTKKGVSVQVKKANPRKVIAGTFIAKTKSGQKGVFARDWAGFGSYYQPNPRRKIAYAKLPEKFRYPLSFRMGPRIPDYFGDKGPVMTNVLKKADDRLHKNLLKEINYELSKL